jgi:hypothetical protein
VAASQPLTGIALVKWAEKRPVHVVSGSKDPCLVAETGADRSPIVLTDSFLSSVIEAFTSSGNYEAADDLIHVHLGTDRTPSEWLLSYHAAVKMLFAQGRSEDAMLFFHTLLSSNKNPDAFTIAAENLAQREDWSGVEDLYRLALSSGCLSEELSLLAMKSATEVQQRATNKKVVLRNIAEEMAKFLGASTGDWLESRYWELRRHLGGDHARTLMGWNDPKINHLDELNFALEVVEGRAAAGLLPEIDAIRLIVQNAGSVYRYALPKSRYFPCIPHNHKTWVSVLAKGLDEAKRVQLFENSPFIGEAAQAWSRLGCDIECIHVVNDALSRGSKVPPAALELAHQVSENVRAKKE